MGKQIEESQQNTAVINQELGRSAISEADLCWTLGIDRRVLDGLRAGKGFPTVYLNRTSRVYLVHEVTDWLKQHSSSR